MVDRVIAFGTGMLWFLAGILTAALWLTCHAESEPRVAPLAGYQLALDAGIEHDGDARP